ANPDGQSGMLASAFTYRHADVNGNGSITSLDALCTLRQVASLPATTSCPAPPSSAQPAAAADGANASGWDRWLATLAAILGSY
ncbi:MAG: hypothetical protein HY690_14935, partial [Chloroflexi bacterium]|nr:hypothetical protein [Chloroflexota bacterium]